MKINYENASFKDFENIPGLDPYQWANLFSDYSRYKKERGQMNYRLMAVHTSVYEGCLLTTITTSTKVGAANKPKVSNSLKKSTKPEKKSLSL